MTQLEVLSSKIAVSISIWGLSSLIRLAKFGGKETKASDDKQIQ